MQLSQDGGGVLPNKRLLGMCCWMGSHFHNWTDYNGVTFLVELLEWGRKLSGFLGLENSGKQGFKNRKICGWKMVPDVVLTSNSWLALNFILEIIMILILFCPKVTKIGSIAGHRIDFKWGRCSEKPAAHTCTQQNLTQVPSLGQLSSMQKGYCAFACYLAPPTWLTVLPLYQFFLLVVHVEPVLLIQSVTTDIPFFHEGFAFHPDSKMPK